MTEFKIGDIVRLKNEKPERLPLIVKEFRGDIMLCRSELGTRSTWATFAEVELIERRDPQADMKQAIREVLLSDEFMKAFAAAFCSATVPQYTFSFDELSLVHPTQGVNRPMRSDDPASEGGNQ
jgi:hypothetical protein